MRRLGLIGFALGLLTVEGAVCRLLHVEMLRPDPILVLVVYLAFRAGTASAVEVFVLGLLADGFAGTPSGMLTMIYLIVWTLVKMAQAFLIPERRLIQFGILFLMSLVFDLLLVIVLVSLPGRGGPVSSLLVWTLPLALLNLAMAGPIWSLARWILGSTRKKALFGAR